MTVAELYPLIRAVHVTCAAASGLFFALRGLWAIHSPRAVRRKGVRRTAQSIDILFLASGLALAVITSQAPWNVPWLGAKLTALLGYILLGMVALHWARRRWLRATAGLGALACFLYIVSVALTRSPQPWG